MPASSAPLSFIPHYQHFIPPDANFISHTTPLRRPSIFYTSYHYHAVHSTCHLSSSSSSSSQKKVLDHQNPTQHVSSSDKSSDQSQILPPRDLDVVITHSSADFDSLAAAVGLARLRGPNTVVVTPGGESPSLRRFLALHRQLFHIVDAKAIDPRRLRWVGVVDTVRRDRLGVASDWPEQAQAVEIYDHHVGRECDITNQFNNLNLIVEPVGAVCTLICERLMREKHKIPPTEATLLALAIHSDTGSLTFEHTTSRDAIALSWLLEQGALQRSIAEFTQNFLTDEQQSLLSHGLSTVRRHMIHGVEIGSLFLVGKTFLKGMSAVASDLLDIANLDVLVLAYVNCRGRKAAKKKRRIMDDDEFCGPEQLKQVSIIGRARARVDGVNFNTIFSNYGGGGHARAASVTLKLTEADAESLVESIRQDVMNQIPPAKAVYEFMSTLLVTVTPSMLMKDAANLMSIHGHQILPVVNGEKILLGLISVHDVQLAKRRRGDHGLDMQVKSWMHHHVITVDQHTPFHVAENALKENTLGMLPVVDEHNLLLGAITRTDVLIARRMWPEQLKKQYGGQA